MSFSKPIAYRLALSQVRGAARVILIDNVADRLSFAQSKIPGLEVVDFNKVMGDLSHLGSQDGSSTA